MSSSSIIDVEKWHLKFFNLPVEDNITSLSIFLCFFFKDPLVQFYSFNLIGHVLVFWIYSYVPHINVMGSVFVLWFLSEFFSWWKRSLPIFCTYFIVDCFIEFAYYFQKFFNWFSCVFEECNDNYANSGKGVFSFRILMLFFLFRIFICLKPFIRYLFHY